jgi:tRNA A37 methylthiotransferase MiaB
MPDKVPPRVIRDRAAQLRELSQKKNLEFRQRFLRQQLPAISLSREEGMGESIVLTDNFIHARVEGDRVPVNRLVDVRILDAQPECTSAAIL